MPPVCVEVYLVDRHLRLHQVEDLLHQVEDLLHHYHQEAHMQSQRGV